MMEVKIGKENRTILETKVNLFLQITEVTNLIYNVEINKRHPFF